MQNWLLKPSVHAPELKHIKINMTLLDENNGFIYRFRPYGLVMTEKMRIFVAKLQHHSISN